MKTLTTLSLLLVTMTTLASNDAMKCSIAPQGVIDNDLLSYDNSDFSIEVECNKVKVLDKKEE